MDGTRNHTQNINTKLDLHRIYCTCQSIFVGPRPASVKAPTPWESTAWVAQTGGTEVLVVVPAWLEGSGRSEFPHEFGTTGPDPGTYRSVEQVRLDP